VLEIPHTQERVVQSAVSPVEAWRLDQPLADVHGVRRHATDEVGPFQEVAVAQDGLVVEVEAGSDLGRVQGLAVQGGEHVKEARRHGRSRREAPGRQVSRGQRLEVVLLPARVHLRTEDSAVRKAALEPQVVHLADPELRKEEGAEVHRPQTAGEGLRDVRHEGRRDRAEEEEAAVALPVRVDRAAKPGEDLGSLLRLVEDEEPRSRGECLPLRVEADHVALLLQIQVGPRESPDQGRLAALAWSKQGDGGETGEQQADPTGMDSRDHVL
jgi:hypothetical protein